MTRDELFPTEIQLAAQHSQRTTGVPACATLAQWALESDYGKALAAENNPFGIKWTSGCPWPPGPKVPTHEYVAGSWLVQYVQFVAFPTLEAAFEYHGKMLTNPAGYYAQCLPKVKSWQAWMQCMAATYATDPNYFGKLLGIVNGFRLFELKLA